MLYVRTGPKDTQNTAGKKLPANRRQQSEPRQSTLQQPPIGLVILSIALILASIVGLLVLNQLPPAITANINAVLAEKSLPPQAAQILTLLQTEITKLVGALRPFFIVAIVLSLVLWILHRWVYWAVLAVFGIYVLYFLKLASQTSALQIGNNIAQAASLQHRLSTIYTTLAGANFLILVFLLIYYRAYARASQNRWG